MNLENKKKLPETTAKILSLPHPYLLTSEKKATCEVKTCTIK